MAENGAPFPDEWVAHPGTRGEGDGASAGPKKKARTFHASFGFCAAHRQPDKRNLQCEGQSQREGAIAGYEGRATDHEQDLAEGRSVERSNQFTERSAGKHNVARMWPKRNGF